MRQQLDTYLQLLVARNYSLTRQEQNKLVIERLIAYCESIGVYSWPGVTSQMIEEFFLLQSQQTTKTGQQRAKNTVSIWKSCIRVFFTHLLKSRQILDNPAQWLKVPPKEKATSKEILTYKQMDDLLELPNIETTIGLRDKALMELLYGTGVRISEAQKLNLYDLNLERREILLRETKTGKSRIVPLTEESVCWLEKYLKEARPNLAKKKKSPTDAVWLSSFGQRVGNMAIQIRIRQYGAKLSLKVTANTFRHTFASHLLEQGANINDIRRLLGHNYLSSTEIYSQVSNVSLKQVIEKISKS